MIEAQLAREEQTRLDVAAQAVEQMQAAMKAGNVSALPGTSRVVVALFNDLEERYKAIQETTVRGPAGALRGWFREVPSASLAVLALNEVMSMFATVRINKPLSVQDICVQMGKRIHLEAQVLQAEAVSPIYVRQTEESIKAAGTRSLKHITRTYRKLVSNVLQYRVQLSVSDYLNLGKLAVNELIDLAVLVRVYRGEHSERLLHMYELNASIQDAMEEIPAVALRRGYRSMLCPPEPWVGLFGGGYLSDATLALVSPKNIPRECLPELDRRLQESDLPDTVNQLQNIPYRIDTWMHDTVQRIWQNGGGVLGIPTQHIKPAPEYPLPQGWKEGGESPEQQALHSQWVTQMRSWYTYRKKVRADIRALRHLQKSLDEPEVFQYFPIFMDSRGRMYYRGLINPQGSDLSKALLHYGERKPLGEHGLFWLKVALANAFGVDSIRFKKRAEWVDSNLELILDGIERPEDSDFFRGNTEAPLQAVSIAKELVGALNSPDPRKYLSSVIVHMDATCSGLQHLSAILRDAEGGARVNLFDNGLEQKSDVYRYVAEQASKIIAEDAKAKKHAAIFWERVGITRNLVKQPVMTYVYGVTRMGVIRYVEDYLNELGQLRNSTWEYNAYCADVLLQAIAATVPKAAEFMNWLQDVARQNTGIMQWTTAAGMPVYRYRESERRKRVKVRSCNIVDVVLYERTGKVNRAAMINAIVPDLVHSCDAAHWFLTAKACLKAGIASTGVHDSFGTHAGSVQDMHRILREEFIRTHEYDLTSDFIEQNNVDIPPPELGDLDLNLFLDSEFAFS